MGRPYSIVQKCTTLNLHWVWIFTDRLFIFFDSNQFLLNKYNNSAKTKAMRAKEEQEENEIIAGIQTMTWSGGWNNAPESILPSLFS